MSHAELQRFAAAIQAEPALAERYATAATAAELAERLRADGYDISDAEVEEAQARGSELSDGQLDAVSGGLAVSAVIAANIFALVLGGAVVASAIGIVADAARKGTLPKG